MLSATPAQTKFLSTLREEGDQQSTSKAGSGAISIHALREEGDAGCKLLVCWCHISIHALREEGDLSISLLALWSLLFLSTPSARRATFATHQYCNDAEPFLSTPSARRATLDLSGSHDAVLISIHALREEGDPRTAGTR